MDRIGVVVCVVRDVCVCVGCVRLCGRGRIGWMDGMVRFGGEGLCAYVCACVCGERERDKGRRWMGCW